MIHPKIWIARDSINNFFSRQSQLTFITEAADWAIKFITTEWANALKAKKLLRARVSSSPLGLRNQIVHYGSINVFLNKQGPQSLHQSNKKVVVTWFHVLPNENRWPMILEKLKRSNIIHAACRITRDTLVSHGVKPEKIKVIPIGVNTGLFFPPSPEMKAQVKKELGIPEGKFVIGSFQKDGEGWGEGLKPKLIKGPDIFVQTLKQLAKNFPIHALIVGPARGYVKAGLAQAKISYTHLAQVAYGEKIARCYWPLDAYLIGSRLEGGPMQFLESWASGVPLVSTRVGMMADFAKDGSDILLADSEDTRGLANHLAHLIERPDLAREIKENALKKVGQYDWKVLAARYYHEIYEIL